MENVDFLLSKKNKSLKKGSWKVSKSFGRSEKQKVNMFVKDVKIFLKKRKTKSKNMSANDKKSSWRWKAKASWEMDQFTNKDWMTFWANNCTQQI